MNIYAYLEKNIEWYGHTCTPGLVRYNNGLALYLAASSASLLNVALWAELNTDASSLDI